MQKYTTNIHNLLPYLSPIQFNKDELLLFNFLKQSSNLLGKNNGNLLDIELQHILKTKDTRAITDTSKINDFIDLAKKGYRTDTLSQMIDIYVLLFNQESITFNDNFSLDPQEQTILLAQHFSGKKEVSFWSSIDPMLAPTPIEATIEITTQSFQEKQFEAISNNSSWKDFIIPNPPSRTEAYPDISHLSYNIYEHSKLSIEDPLDVCFLLDKISTIDSKIDSNKKFSSIPEWREILNIPHHLRNGFYDEFSKYLTPISHNGKNNVNALKKILFNKTLDKIPHHIITDPEVINALLRNVMNINFINSCNNNANFKMLMTDPEFNKMITEHDLLNSPNFLKSSFKKLSPLHLLNLEQLNQADNYQFQFTNNFYVDILRKLTTLDKSDQTIENLASGESQQAQQFLTYFSKYISLFEEEITSNPEDITTTLLHFKKTQNELFLWGFPFFTDNFKNNPEVLKHLSGVIFFIHKNNPFGKRQYEEFENHILNAILASYSDEDLHKNKKDLLNLSTSYFMTPKANDDIDKPSYASSYINNIVESSIVKEFSKILNEKSLVNVDMQFLYQMFHRFQRTGDIQKFINIIDKYPELDKLGDPDVLKNLTNYFLLCLENIKNKYEGSNTPGSNTISSNLTDLVLSISHSIIFYAYAKNPRIFNENVLDITFDNFKRYKSLLGTSAHFSMINSKIITQLNIDNPQHQEFAFDLICRFNKKVSMEIIKHPEIKPFFMLDSIIQGLYGNTKFVEFNKESLTLGNIYSANDVKTLFERYGHDNQNWFNFCPDTFLALAPLEFKQNTETWITLFKKYQTNIFPYIPLNLKNNPDFFLTIINEDRDTMLKVHHLFSASTINSIHIVQHILEKYPNESTKVYPELLKYMNEKGKDFSGLPLIEKFNLLFTDKILEKAIPIKEATTAKKPIKF